jgi:hypothetical protein
VPTNCTWRVKHKKKAWTSRVGFTHSRHGRLRSFYYIAMWWLVAKMMYVMCVNVRVVVERDRWLSAPYFPRLGMHCTYVERDIGVQ